jgi:hypothetical protein
MGVILYSVWTATVIPISQGSAKKHEFERPEKQAFGCQVFDWREQF